MEVEIFNTKETLDAVVALKSNRRFVVLNRFYTDPSEYVNVRIKCNSIMVTDDLISIEFPDGRIADYEIARDKYHFIKII